MSVELLPALGYAVICAAIVEKCVKGNAKQLLISVLLGLVGGAVLYL